MPWTKKTAAEARLAVKGLFTKGGYTEYISNHTTFVHTVKYEERLLCFL